MGKIMKYDFRDVSLGLRKLRDFLLGRKHTHHGRFMPQISPRSIPAPDIPRGSYKYSDQGYWSRNILGSVRPPVVAPVGVATPKSSENKLNPNAKLFSAVPTPGSVWWFDAHCYYKDVSVGPCVPPPPPRSPCRAPPEAPMVRVKKLERPICERETSMQHDRGSSVCDPCDSGKKKPGK